MDFGEYETKDGVKNNMFDYKNTFKYHTSISFDLRSAISQDKEGIPYSHVRTLLETHIKLFYGDSTFSEWNVQISKFCFFEYTQPMFEAKNCIDNEEEFNSYHNHLKKYHVAHEIFLYCH